jgi:transcriptional regulator with XRE-family HTH domain
MAESDETPNGAGDWAESDVHIAFGLAIRVRRTFRGLSQEQLAVRAGLHRNYLGAVERGEINPTLHTIARITRGLDMPLADLLIETDERLTDLATLAQLRAKRLRRRRLRLSRAAAEAASEQTARAGDDGAAPPG